jgi:hypothetical protein
VLGRLTVLPGFAFGGETVLSRLLLGLDERGGDLGFLATADYRGGRDSLNPNKNTRQMGSI